MNHLMALVLNFMIVLITALRVECDVFDFYTIEILTQGLIAAMIVLIFYLVSLKWLKE